MIIIITITALIFFFSFLLCAAAGVLQDRRLREPDRPGAAVSRRTDENGEGLAHGCGAAGRGHG